MAREPGCWPRLVLRPNDQWVAGILLALALAGLGLHWSCQMLLGRGFVEIDRAQPREIRFLVDINTADWPELALLPGVGEQLAKGIVAYREEHGPFRDLAELDNVRGIGPRTLELIRPYVLPIPEVEATVERGAEDRTIKRRKS
jgi:competence protein ComEA